MIDPTTEPRSGKPNDALICPQGACAAAADRPAPVLAVAPERLFAAWIELIEATPRAAVVRRSPETLQIEAVVRSRVFRFVDRVAVKVLELETGASFAASSRSESGYYDFGVNRRRLAAWTTALADRLRAPSGTARTPR